VFGRLRGGGCGVIIGVWNWPDPARQRDVLDYGELPTMNVVVRLIEQAAPLDELDL